MNQSKKKNDEVVITPIDLRILNYLFIKKTPASVYDIMKHTKYSTKTGKLKKISYDAIQNHCKTLSDNKLITECKKLNPNSPPGIRYQHDFTKTSKILSIIEKQRLSRIAQANQKH